MASTSDTLSPPSSRFICFYGSEMRYQLDSCCPTLVWYGAELNDNNNNKRKRESYDFGHLIQLPLFQEIVPGDFARPSTVPLGSNIYCFLSGGRRVLCLDTTRPQIGWTEIAFHRSKFRSCSLTAVADGNIYVIGGYTSAQPGPWAEVFHPSTQSWDILDHPCIDHRYRIDDRSFFCASMALDDDGLGFSRKVIVLASYYCNDIHVYDVDAKSWLLPPPPKLDSSFFYTKFPSLQPSCKPVLVHKTVYWYAMPRFFCAYNVENGECSVGYFQNLELMVDKSPHNDDHSPLLLLHLDGPRFCLFWSHTLLVFRSCKGPPYKVSGRNANASISVDSIHNFFPGAYGFAPEGAMIIDGKLEASKSLLVDFLPPILDDIYMGIDLPNIKIITAKEPEGTEEPEGSEAKFVPILLLQRQPPNPISCEDDPYIGIDLPNINIITAKEPEGSESKFVPILRLQGQPPNPISCEEGEAEKIRKGKQMVSSIATASRSNWRRSRDEDSQLELVEGQLGSIAAAIDKLSRGQFVTNDLYEEVMKIERFDDSILSDTFDHLVENEKQAKAFMAKSVHLRKAWIDKFIN